MSANENLLDDGGGGSSTYRFSSDELVEPQLKQGGITVTPVATNEVEITTNGNSVYHTDMCSHTETEKMGNTEWFVTLEGLCTKSQLSDLKKMNPADGEIKFISEGHVGYVEFDRFTATQSSEHQIATFFKDGEEIKEPVFSFQIQSRDDDSD